MNFSKARVISLIVAFGGLAVAVIPFLISENSSSVFLIVGLAVAAVGALINVVFCRCPSCGRFVQIRSFSIPDYCPFCGEELDSDSDDDNNDEL